MASLLTPRWFLAWLALINVLLNMGTGLVPAVLSSLQRRYGYSTTALGALVSVGDFVGLLAALPIGYYGECGRGCTPSSLQPPQLYICCSHANCACVLVARPRALSQRLARPLPRQLPSLAVMLATGRFAKFATVTAHPPPLLSQRLHCKPLLPITPYTELTSTFCFL